MLFAVASYAQDFPSRPIRLVTADAGGGNDFAARLIAQGIASGIGQPVYVENRPANFAGELLVKAAPDGYSLLLASSSFIIAPLMQRTPYDPIRDFLPISLATLSPNVLVVHPSLPVRSVKDLIALAKRKPGELNYASGPNGTSSHLAAELFKAMAGIDVVRIAYKGGGPAANALIAGEVQVMFATTGTAMPYVNSRRLRALAVTTAEPSVLVPDLPTVAASGVPAYQAISFNAVFAPAKTPAAIVNRLSQEIARLLKTADTREKFLSSGIEPVGSTPEQLASMIKAEVMRMGTVIKQAHITAD